MKFKPIKTFIRRAIKADASPTDFMELQRLLDQMSTADLQEFWMYFAADRAFSGTLSVPHWKTKEQEVCFQHEHMSWVFQPKERDASGKYIVVRKDLEEHIKTHFHRYIDGERAIRTRQRAAQHRRSFGFYVTLAFIGIFVSVVILARLDTGNWNTGIAVFCLILMALAIFVVSSTFYAIEGTYYRWKKRRQNAKDQTL